MGFGASRRDPATGDVLKAALGFGGLTMCLTLMFLGMRAVMDIGGACADGGPYVSAQPCPEGAPLAMVAGIFGGFLFGAIAMVYGGRLGGIWGAVPLLAWTALFASLGWNFLDYGLFNPPLSADGIVWGWIIPGVIFEVMAFGPLLVAIPVIGVSRAMPTRRQDRAETKRVAQPPSATTAAHAAAGVHAARRGELGAIAADMGAVITQADAATPADPLARLPGAGDDADNPAVPGGDPGSGFAEGTQALLDRLERLGDMRDRNLLSVEEFETAKAAIIAELETRS